MNAKETKPDPASSPPPHGTLRVVPLGGVGEFGKNALALDFGEDLILIDCGQKMPEEDMFGVDMVIPDFSFVLQNIDRLRGVVLTHGHEDHIGGVPYLLRQLPGRCIPIFGTRLTLALVNHKLREMELEGRAHLIQIEEGIPIDLGVFQLDFIPVAHSIPMAMAIFIRTPLGMVVHTGDYKFEIIDGKPCEGVEALRNRAQREPVLLLMADSTNVDRKGCSPTEDVVREGLDGVLAEAKGGVIVATFASSLSRVQTVLELAEKHHRKVALCGYSLERNFGIAAELGLLRYREHLLRPLHEIAHLPPNERLILTTGTQGEPQSALSRLSLNTMKGYKIKPGDLIILSSRIIPGNERSIYRMINHFYRHGARVITERDARVHASGHACRDEMGMLLDLMNSRYFMPVHGEARHLILHRDLAMEHGFDSQRVLVMENGNHALIDGSGLKIESTDWSGQVLVDGKMLDGLNEVVLRDRKHLSGDGMVTAILVIDRASHKIIAGPDIVSRGFILVDESETLIQECKDLIIQTFESCNQEEQEEWDVVKLEVRRALRRFLSLRTDRYPVILPVVVEI